MPHTKVIRERLESLVRLSRGDGCWWRLKFRLSLDKQHDLVERIIEMPHIQST